MRIVITGGAGCLGSNLMERFLPQGHEICIIDNFATGKREVIPNLPGISLIEGSIANRDLVFNVFRQFQPTHVIHSAASYKDPGDWEEDTLTNVLGTINIIKASEEVRVSRIINFQTALVYGQPKKLPIPVDHPLAPFTSYGITKSAGESFLIKTGLSFVSLRLANICGPRLAIGPIPTFYKRVKSGQKCFCSDTTRDFLDMSDFLDLMDIVLLDESSTGVFNVSSGEGHSIKEIFDVVVKYLAIDVPDPPIVPPATDDVKTVVLDPSETKRVFGWDAKTSFQETIFKQLQWYDEHGVTDIYSHLTSLITKK